MGAVGGLGGGGGTRNAFVGVLVPVRLGMQLGVVMENNF